eukprot:12885101-Prorocentrum_lima.AAC.1
MTGKASYVRVCLGPEPVTKAPPTDRPPCAHVPVKAAPPEPSAQSTDAQCFAYACHARRVRGSPAFFDAEGNPR